MELTSDDINLIDRFLNNELTSAELILFQEKLKDPDFNIEFIKITKAIEIVKNAGHEELKKSLQEIHAKVKVENGFEKYKNAGKRGSGFFDSLIVIVIIGAIVAGYIYSVKNNVFDDAEKNKLGIDAVDTIYHYQINRDTVYADSSVNAENATRVSVKRTSSELDTVFESQIIKSDSLTPGSPSSK